SIKIGGVPGALDAQNKLVETATQYLAGLGSDAVHDTQLSLEVAQSYMQLARVQGVPAWNNFGRYAEAAENVRKAETFADAVLASDPYNREALYVSANAAHDRASIGSAAGSPDQVIAGGLKVRQRFDQLVRLGNLTRKEMNAATYIYADLADDHTALHRF